MSKITHDASGRELCGTCAPGTEEANHPNIARTVIASCRLVTPARTGWASTSGSKTERPPGFL
jgi:hypothetical protein